MRFLREAPLPLIVICIGLLAIANLTLISLMMGWERVATLAPVLTPAWLLIMGVYGVFFWKPHRSQ